MFLKLRGKFTKLKKKTQNSRKKLKLWEDFTPPERPIVVCVIKKPELIDIGIGYLDAFEGHVKTSKTRFYKL